MSKTSVTTLLEGRNTWGDLINDGCCFLCSEIFKFFPSINHNGTKFEFKISSRPFKGSRKVPIKKNQWGETVWVTDQEKESSLFCKLRGLIDANFSFRGKQKRNIYFSLTEKH